MESCDACSTRQWVEGSKIPDHAHNQLFTFGIGYRAGEDTETWYEEIDIWATSFAQASDLARIVTDEGYQPGYTEIVTLQPGGSGGLIQVWSS